MPIAGTIIVLAAGITSFLVAGLVYRNAGRLGVVQDPNERSSHTRPTPGGGGLGIVVGGTIGSAYAMWILPGGAFVVAMLAVVMAIVGFIDDRQHVAASVRLIVQLILVGVMVWTLQPLALTEALRVPFTFELAVPLVVIASIYWINLFNFMDGIDGLAATQAIFMIGAGLWLAVGGGAMADAHFWWFAAVGAATIGFLLLNWPPARIFMGDAGSTYLGFMIAFAALTSIVLGWLTIWQWLILGAVFISDATVTILRRAFRGENVLAAHRIHAYQHLSRRWGSHLPVTLIAIAINLIVLLPLAWVVGAQPERAPMVTGAVYLALCVLVLLAGAGAPEKSVPAV